MINPALTNLNHSGGSLLLVIVWHGVYNFVAATQAAVDAGAIAATVSTLIMVQGIALIVLDLHARRRGRPSVLGPAQTTSAQRERRTNR